MGEDACIEESRIDIYVCVSVELVTICSFRVYLFVPLFAFLYSSFVVFPRLMLLDFLAFGTKHALLCQ